MFRLVGDAPRSAKLLPPRSLRAEAREVVHTLPSAQPSMGFHTTVVSFTTDIPSFAGAWAAFSSARENPPRAHRRGALPKKQLLER